MGFVVCSSQAVSAAPSSPGERLLTLLHCSSMGSLPQETVLHKLLQHESFPRATDLHKLLQRGSPVGSQVLPANLCQHGFLSRRVTGPTRSLLQHGLPMRWQRSSGASPWSGVGSSLGHRWGSAPPWASMAAGTACLTVVCSMAAGESLLRRLEHLLPLLLHWPWCLQSCASQIFSLLSPAAIALVQLFPPFLNKLSQRRYHCCWGAQPWPAAGPSWSWLALALSDIEEASSSFTQKPPL